MTQWHFNQYDEMEILAGELSLYTKESREVIYKWLKSKNGLAKVAQILSDDPDSLLSYESVLKSIEGIQYYIHILNQIMRVGIKTSFTPDKKSVKDVKAMKEYYKTLAYPTNQERYNGPDCADEFDAQERYEAAVADLRNL